MSNTRALVSCTILSLKDSSFVYPFCKCCLSRLTQESNERASCARCGFTCDPQHVDYRYRLSMKVSRNQDIFGVTVFGGCLNPFFGITAGGLQRCIELERSDGTHTVQQLLIKAVEDCFIGRCVVLGLKGSCDDVKTWSSDQPASSLFWKSKQLVAYQIISPSEACAGSTVIGYFKNLLQSNSCCCDSESANSCRCLPQQKDSQSLEGDELNSFDHTLPSCARLDSQVSRGEFTVSSAWQTPGLCFTPKERNNDSIQSPKNEDKSTCVEPSVGFLTDRCFCSSPLDQLKHGLQGELTDETQNSHRKSFSTSCDMFESSVHFNSSKACDPIFPSKAFYCVNDSKTATSCQCVLKPKSGEKYDAPYFDTSLLSRSGQHICLDLEDAPLSEDLLNFVKAEPQNSEIMDAKQMRFLNKHSSGKQDKIQKRCSLNENSTFPNNTCPGNHEITVNNAVIPKSPNVLCAKKKKRILSDLNCNFSPRILRVFHLPQNNRLCFSNRKGFTSQRKRLTRNTLSVPLCSPNHEESKYFRKCLQSEVRSVNCKVKQEQNVCDSHQDVYNCSADLFACQNSTDMNQSDVSEVSKVYQPRNVNTSEPVVSGSVLDSPRLQSTPVSYQHSFRQKAGWSQKRIDSLCSSGLKLKFTGEVTGLRENRLNKPKVTVSELNQLQVAGSIKRFSDESNVQETSFDLSVNGNEWSRDLFDSF